jgi:hypothetical protein
MALRVEDLQTALVSTSALENQVREQLLLIDTRIRESDRVFGENLITVNLPTSFGVPGLDKMEQQRFVYSEIIDSLKLRKFEVRIFLGKDSATIYIKYVVRFNVDQVEAMSDIIRASVIKAEEIPTFVNSSKKLGLLTATTSPAKKSSQLDGGKKPREREAPPAPR